MPTNMTAVHGDERTEELRAMNEKEIQPEPEEMQDWAESHLIHIYNVSPYPQIVEHPMVGRLTIPACKPGQEYSEPAILKGTIPQGICVEMKSVEIRRESGRVFAVDVLGIGPFKDKKNSLLRWGVFIAAEDTFDPEDLVTMQLAAKVKTTVPRWCKSGKFGVKPTVNELAKANERFAQTDFALIAEADEYWNQGPQHQQNIGTMHREALRRRGQQREWDKPLQSLVDCPGCGEKVKPNIKKHVACGWLFADGRFAGDEVKETRKRS